MNNLIYSDFAAIIYDVDDTLLDNHPGGSRFNLHEQSRFEAIISVAEEMGIAALNGLTEEENEKAFHEAPTHTVDAAVWNLLTRRGVVPHGDIDLKHKILTAIIDKKAELHMAMLLEKGVEVPGASAFIVARHAHLPKQQAIASGARHDEIDVFLGKYDLSKIIPMKRRVARGDYIEPKPNPESFNAAFARLKLPDTPEIRKRTVVFEDDPKGIEGALRGGFTVVGLTTRFTENTLMSTEHKPHFIIPDFTDIDKLFT